MSVSSHRAVVDFLDFGEKPRDSFLIKYLIRSCWCYIGERWLIKQCRVHDTLIGQVLDDHVDELDLCRCRGAGREEFTEGPVDSRAVEPDQRTHEAAETVANATSSA